MVNGLAAWGNKWLLPLGPLREPLSALKRADLAVIHHADMVIDRCSCFNGGNAFFFQLGICLILGSYLDLSSFGV